MSQTISQIYTNYHIMPSLQLHMYRVAAVAQLICEHLNIQLDSNRIISACLLHDMGNILKFKLNIFPEFLEPEGYDYWKKVQEEYKEKYGNDEHTATLKIARELGVSERTFELMYAVGFSKAQENFEHNDFDKKICAYADMRVQPHGVTSLAARLEDGRKRFQLRTHSIDNDDFFEKMAGYLEKIEAQIFSHVTITAQDITESIVIEKVDALSKFKIE